MSDNLGNIFDLRTCFFGNIHGQEVLRSDLAEFRPLSLHEYDTGHWPVARTGDWITRHQLPSNVPWNDEVKL